MGLGSPNVSATQACLEASELFSSCVRVLCHVSRLGEITRSPRMRPIAVDSFSKVRQAALLWFILSITFETAVDVSTVFWPPHREGSSIESSIQRQLTAPM
jgi:hypothetical protein